MWPKNRLCHMNLSTFMWPFCEYTFYDAAVRKRFRVVAIVSSHTFVCWSCCWNILEWEMASFECKETNYKSFVDFWQRDIHFMYEMKWVLNNGLLALRPSFSSSFNNGYSQQHLARKDILFLFIPFAWFLATNCIVLYLLLVSFQSIF